MNSVLAGVVVAVAVPLLTAAPRAAHADEPRSVDFGSGLVLAQQAGTLEDTSPGLGLALRLFPGGGPSFVGLGAGVELDPDLSNPEAGELDTRFTLGVGAGRAFRLAGPLELFVGGHADAIALASDGEATRLGWRAGPMASLALAVAAAWGHPMALEARAALFMGSDSARDGLWVGFFVTGTLFPDRPL